MNPFTEFTEAFGIHTFPGEVLDSDRLHTEVAGCDFWLVQSLAPVQDAGEFWVCDSNGDALSAKYPDAASAVEALSDLLIDVEGA